MASFYNESNFYWTEKEGKKRISEMKHPQNDSHDLAYQVYLKLEQAIAVINKQQDLLDELTKENRNLRKIAEKIFCNAPSSWRE